jgi:hypothetical protein
MSAEPPDAADDAPANRRLHQLLVELRVDAPAAPDLLVDRIVRTARWERSVRHTGHSLGTFGGTFLEGMGILLGVVKVRR